MRHHSMMMGALALLAAACGGGSDSMDWPTVTATVNGAPAEMTDGDNGVRNYQVHGLNVADGARVRLEASEPGYWLTGSSGASDWDVVKTETSWEATIHYSGSMPGKGFMTVDFCRPPCAERAPIVEVVIMTRG